jgi:CheY-like chemotaxis protein
LLAGRKLLLADDSVTIQKVIELTFADEGVRVVAFGNGADAIDRLEEEAPDIVLADVFMPSKSGYEVCEYVKQNEKLKHVPVMLLVGSFEPFDEAEARRVGADDILTKPFQSIRRLIDRVGALVANPPTQKEVATMELPVSDDKVHDDVQLSTQELEVMTADTQQFPAEMQETLEFPQSALKEETESHEDKMETQTVAVDQELRADSSDVLLDLGEIEHADVMDSDEFVLDLEDTLGGDDEPVPMRSFVEPQVTETSGGGLGQSMSYQPEVQAAFAPVETAAEVAYEDQVHEIAAEPVRVSDYELPVAVETEPQPVAAATVAAAVNPGELSQEMIDAIARRVVEMMSDKVVREVAWEVVPDLSELLIKKQLEDQQPK